MIYICVSGGFRSILRCYNAFPQVLEGPSKALGLASPVFQRVLEVLQCETIRFKIFHGDSGQLRRFQMRLKGFHRLSDELHGVIRGFQKQYKALHCVSGSFGRLHMISGELHGCIRGYREGRRFQRAFKLLKCGSGHFMEFLGVSGGSRWLRVRPGSRESFMLV